MNYFKVFWVLDGLFALLAWLFFVLHMPWVGSFCVASAMIFAFEAIEAYEQSRVKDRQK